MTSRRCWWRGRRCARGSGDEDQFERGKDDAGIAHHVGKQFTENLIAVAVYLIVGGKDTLREFNIAADDGVEGVAHHLLGEFAHTRQIDVGLHARWRRMRRAPCAMLTA